ncbi:hypothetical protein NL676_034803 [Syzygium grande]|nr:hypothetical protein NL676_034803 [Syzygium grande]
MPTRVQSSREPWDNFTPDGKVSDPNSPPENPGRSQARILRAKPESRAEPSRKEPMAVEHEEEEEEEPIEIDSDSESESSGSDLDWAL